MLSHRCQRTFHGRNLRVRNGRTVHEVDWMDGLGGHQYPSPGCHVGTTGFDLDAFVPTHESVTCERCLRNIRGRANPGELVLTRGQLALELDGVPAPLG